MRLDGLATLTWMFILNVTVMLLLVATSVALLGGSSCFTLFFKNNTTIIKHDPSLNIFLPYHPNLEIE